MPASQPGGRLVTLENAQCRAAEAGQNLAAAGVTETVELRLAEAGQVLAIEKSSAWRLVLLDAERPAYVSYWPELCRILAPGGLLVVNNCISHAGQIADFRRLVDTTVGYRSSLVLVEAGLLLIEKDR